MTLRESELERERGVVIARHVKRLAEQHPTLRAIRKFLFGNPAELVSEVEAARLLRSPATQFLRKQDFADHGIPWLGHKAKVETIKPGHTEEASWRDYRIQVRWSGGEQVIRTRITLADSHGRGPRTVDLPGSRGLTPYAVHGGTWLWSLVRAAEDMAGDVGWSTAEAALFILTGTAPDPRPLMATLHRPEWGSPAIALRVQPFVDAKRVLAEYRAAQQRLDGPRVFRRRRRPIQDRALRLFDFVEEHSAPFNLVESRRRRRSWGAVLAAWNRWYPDWQYEEARALRRDYILARGRLLRGMKDHARA